MRTDINPGREAFAELLARADEGPVVMLNLLKFRDDAGDGETGRQAYNRYAQAIGPMIEELGGRTRWIGDTGTLLVGDPQAQDWDAILLVEYPTRRAFADMVSRPDYLAAHEHRERALERTLLLQTHAVPGGAPF
ncbi:MAG TPA: DUF1330 domain-containing protein [Egibacteraceae bacterium]|nr:DUF1330 domain-containing protein [Egibacteraceae bacterium]